jgi:ribosome-associated translation inhibitor RaiA
MQLQMNYANVEASEALETHIRDALESTIGRFADRLTRIEVHLSDLDGPGKSGPNDKRCRIEARPSGASPVMVESVGDSFYEAADDAAGKLRRLLTSRLDR